LKGRIGGFQRGKPTSNLKKAQRKGGVFGGEEGDAKGIEERKMGRTAKPLRGIPLGKSRISRKRTKIEL